MRIAALAAAVASAAATYGVDVSAPVSLDAAKCMVSVSAALHRASLPPRIPAPAPPPPPSVSTQNGRSFAIVRAWESFGHFDGNAPATVANFWGGGMAHVVRGVLAVVGGGGGGRRSHVTVATPSRNTTPLVCACPQDVYMFPCAGQGESAGWSFAVLAVLIVRGQCGRRHHSPPVRRCADPTTQANSLVDSLSANHVKYGM
jgi:hypothetical protein